jgi:hypothetical protein
MKSEVLVALKIEITKFLRMIYVFIYLPSSNDAVSNLAMVL